LYDSAWIAGVNYHENIREETEEADIEDEDENEDDDDDEEG
jgi:hypothetical protein